MFPTLFDDRNFWSSFRDFQREMDRMIQNRQSTSRGAPLFEDAITPYHEVEETESHYLLSLDFPGVSKDNINIELKDNRLTVWGEAKRAGSADKTRVARRFYAEFSLPDTVDEEKVEASYDNGVLHIALPKAEEAKPRQIKIGEGKEGFFGRLVKGMKDQKEAPKPAERQERQVSNA